MGAAGAGAVGCGVGRVLTTLAIDGGPHSVEYGSPSPLARTLKVYFVSGDRPEMMALTPDTSCALCS